MFKDDFYYKITNINVIFVNSKAEFIVEKNIVLIFY